MSEQDPQLEAMRAELSRYRQAELHAQHKAKQEAIARAERSRRRALAIPLVSSIITPIMLAILLALQMCGCARTAPAFPPTTMAIPIGKLLRTTSEGFGFCTVWKVDDNLVATAGHCCAEGTTYQITGASTVPGAELSVLVDDDENDVCILRGSMLGEPLQLAARDPQLGAIVMTAGYPRGVYLRSMGLWSGRISWQNKAGRTESGSVTSTYSQPGASGSPVLDQDGRVVGLINACGMEPDGVHSLELISIATPVEKIRDAIRKARAF